MSDRHGATRDIRTVMEAHSAKLMSIPGVTGVAVGLTSDQQPCILVLVVRETREVRKKVPANIEGHPVEIMVTGEIRGMPG
jgi:hypothetical protein